MLSLIFFLIVPCVSFLVILMIHFPQNRSRRIHFHRPCRQKVIWVLYHVNDISHSFFNSSSMVQLNISDNNYEQKSMITDHNSKYIIRTLKGSG